MGCKKKPGLGFGFPTQTCKKNGQTANCRRSLVSIPRCLLKAHIGLLAVVSKTDVQTKFSFFSTNMSKATYFAKVGQKDIHSTLLVQTKLSWKHLICFHFSTAGCKNTSKTEVLLKRCLVFQLGCSGLK